MIIPFEPAVGLDTLEYTVTATVASWCSIKFDSQNGLKNSAVFIDLVDGSLCSATLASSRPFVCIAAG
jgi:hypothetical protein